MQKILVVEDDFDIRELLQNFLQEAGYAVKWSDQHRSGELQPSVYRDFHVSG